MAKDIIASKNVIEQLNYALLEIGDLAGVIEKILITTTSEDDEKAAQAQISAARRLAAQIGFLSDVCQSKIDGMQYKSSAEEWLLSPAYNQYAIKERTAAA